MGFEKRGRYHFPSNEDYAATVHSPEGVKALVTESKLMALLRQLDADGNDISAAATELSALLNYVACTQVMIGDLETHLTYCQVRVHENATRRE